ncbi:MAG: D-aminoacyl-tRNA deacylase, partial [archaeon]|nr:D-aminoacyl-tRNA deacylase [archaeon]
MKAIIVSMQDEAGMNIKQRLLENFDFKVSYKRFESFPVMNFKDFELYTIQTDQIHANYVNEIKAELLIFASMHKSKDEKPALTAHAIGNFGKAEFGGEDNKLIPTIPSILKNYLNSLKEKNAEKSLQFEVTMEATHHGPTLSKPTIFIELGSNEAGWKNEKAALAIAETIIEQTEASTKFIPSLGVGGNHYCSYFNKLQFD